MKRKWILLTTLICLSLIFAGCTGTQTTGTTEQGSTTTTEGSAEGTTEPNEREVVTITTAARIDNSIAFKDGETIDDNVHTRWMEETLGIKMVNLWTVPKGGDAFSTKVRLDLAGNQPLPDVMFIDDRLLLKDLLDAGVLKDIKDDYDQYASDRIKSNYEDYMQVFDTIARDDAWYGMPMFSGFTIPSNMWIRQDWLDKFDLEAPETLDELEDVMEVFLTQDPNESGSDDTLPLSVSIKDGMASSMGSVDWVFGTFGNGLPTIWMEKDNELVYGSIQPSIQDGLEKLSYWMEKGYIDVEAAILDGNQSCDAFVQGDTGIWFGPYWVPNGRINPLKDNVPGAVYEPYPVPGSDDGNRGVLVADLVMRWVVFNKDFEHIDRYYEYHDYLMDKVLFDTEPDTGRFHYGYHEGYDWRYEDDGTVNNAQHGYDGWMTPKYYMSFFGNQDITRATKYVDSVTRYHFDPDAEPRNEEDRYVKGFDREQIDAGYINAVAREEYGYRNAYVGQPTEGMAKYQERLKTMEIDSFIKIIYGEEPIGYFDQFVSEWLSGGGQEITDEVNAWYASVQN